jgi:acetolactate synthase small subunit
VFSIQVSPGELLDKLSILKIKLEKINDTNAQIILKKEYDLLSNLEVLKLNNISTLYNELFDINKQLWDLENKVRKLEKEENFGKEFINAARSIYKFNDKRALVKKEINILMNSEIREVKQHS